MTVVGPVTRLARDIEFARHMPLSKLLRRAELSLRRRLHDRLGGLESRSEPTPPISLDPPVPLLPARASAIARHDGEYVATFLQDRRVLGRDIDWDVKGRSKSDQLWRMNLHYMEYLEGVDDIAFVELVESWLATNAQMKPAAWRDSWNSYALSIRVVVWMQQIAVRTDRLSVALTTRMMDSLAAQMRFLACNLETDLGGNHLAKNLKALIWAGRFFSGPEADGWRRAGLALLTQEIDKQILPDGVHFERSASYHTQVFCDLLECRHALGLDPLAGKLDDALDRMAQVTADLKHPDGGPALFNDSGLTMAYAPDVALAAYARLRGVEIAPRRVFAFPCAGYFGRCDEGSYVVFDCGRIAPNDLPAHGHGDVLSFEWSVAGQRFVVDQGVYEYVDGERRQRSRAAYNHNTLCFEGADQADFFGAFRCGRRPNVHVLDYETRGDGFRLCGTHDGFDRLPGRPRHIREVVADAQTLRIDDRIEGAASGAARIGFLLHPEVRVSSMASALDLQREGARVIMNASLPIAVELAVWWPDMGLELPTKRLVIALPPGEAGVTTEFRIIAASTRRMGGQ